MHTMPTLIATLLIWAVAPAGALVCAGSTGPGRAAAKAAIGAHFQPARGTLHALVLFARFADEADEGAPAFAGALFDPQRPGSFSHFYAQMSFGRLQVGGTVAPRRYAGDGSASGYAPGAYGSFVRQVLGRADADIDFARFDNDGPDGVPDSGDDDGWVDYVFVNLRSAPSGFLQGGATGVAGLGLEEPYISGDRGFSGQPIRVGGEIGRGAVLQEGNFAQTAGTMAHEFGHSLGLPDLFDTSFQKRPAQAPSEDGAGIGRWGLMGWGAGGWSGAGGPVPLSAWCLEQLGWIGPEDGRLVDVEEDAEGLEVADLHEGGRVYRIPLRVHTPDNVTLWVEYLLLEYRSRAAHHYNREQPASGLLVWHVRSQAADNDAEAHKKVDLVCADGLFRDAGFPGGRVADAHAGGDNLDFWAHDGAYALEHGGNLGDATDPFDGVRFNRLAFDTNPSTLPTPTLARASTGLALENMRPEGRGLRLDLRMPRWAGVLDEEAHWAGRVLVDGDLTVAPRGRLVLFRSTQVRVEGVDRLQGGLDADKIEVRVQGDLVLREASRSQVFNVPRLFEADSTIFAARRPGQTWAGLFIDPRPGAELVLPHATYAIRDAERGLVVEGPPPEGQSLHIRGFLFGGERDGVGRGLYEPGESLRLALEIDNRSALSFFTGVRAFLSWDDPHLVPRQGGGRTRTISFPPGSKQVFFFGSALHLRSDAESGAEVVFQVRIEKDGERLWEGSFPIAVAGEVTAVAGGAAQPLAFALEQNWPNPFNSDTAIGFALSGEGWVELAVYDVLGRKVATLVEGVRPAGTYSAVWDGRGEGGRELASGAYLYRLVAGERVETRKLLLLK